MTNHDSGKLNMKHLFDPYKDKISDKGYVQTFTCHWCMCSFCSKPTIHSSNSLYISYVIATTRAISAGEHLFNSYNHCNICTDYYDWFGSPELFKAYGFVEQYPQRWLFDLARMKFDLDIDSTGIEVVSWLVPPSARGIEMLRKELKRLDEYSSKYRAMDVEMPKNEWSLLWEYFDALHNALYRAIESNTPLSDDVWNLGHDWWVKDGTMKESNLDEHFVRRSKHDVEL